MYDVSDIFKKPSWYNYVFTEFLGFQWELIQALVLYP